jgi:hypothetical protein
MTHEPLVQEALTALDEGSFDVTDWEARFLDTLLTQGFPLTRKQLASLVTMADDYLEPGLADDLRATYRDRFGEACPR